MANNKTLITATYKGVEYTLGFAEWRILTGATVTADGIRIRWKNRFQSRYSNEQIVGAKPLPGRVKPHSGKKRNPYSWLDSGQTEADFKFSAMWLRASW